MCPKSSLIQTTNIPDMLNIINAESFHQKNGNSARMKRREIVLEQIPLTQEYERARLAVKQWEGF